MSSFMDKLRRISGRSSVDGDPNTPKSPRPNVWSSTFDPGSNANMKNVGGSYYDKPEPGNSKTIWGYHLESQRGGGVKAAAGTAPAAQSGDVIDAAELKRMMSAERVEAAMRQADAGGKVDFTKFMEHLRKG